MSVVDIYPEHISADLAKSGLEVADMRVRVLGPNEKHATNTPSSVEGYVIPYFSWDGKPIPFYRVRLYDFNPKYKQLENTGNHVYFPPNFLRAFNDPNCKCLIITEGEKKAARAVKEGYAAIGLGGIDSWRNRVVHLPKDSQLGQAKNGVVARLPAGSEYLEREDTHAKGFTDIINLAHERGLPIVIVYDKDTLHKGGATYQVQTAAARLGYELRFMGIPLTKIRQLILPHYPSYTEDKLGLDDFFEDPKLGAPAFAKALEEVLNARTAFPKHPNPAEFVSKKLQRSRLARSERKALSTAVLCDLDSNGVRLRCPDDDTLYYFKSGNNELIPVTFSLAQNNEFAKTPFGMHLYRTYGLTQTDHALLTTLAAQYTGEDPVQTVSPEMVITVRGDKIYYQLSSGQMIRITADNCEILPNGSDDILFKSGCVTDLDIPTLVRKIGDAQKLPTPLPNYWFDVLREARVRDTADQRNRKAISLLYSISPWFYRWRETQLPIEMMIAEPGSGKAQPLTAKVLTPSGWSTMGDMRVGSKVLRPDGSPATVVAVHPQGQKEIFKVTFHDGSSTECCEDHLWNVQSTFNRLYKKGYKTKTLKEIRQKPLRYAEEHKFRNYIPMFEGNLGQEVSLPLQPYLLGALIGDGCFRDNTPQFTSIDQEILDRVASKLPEGAELRHINGSKYNYRIGGRDQEVRQHLQELGLWNLRSEDKHIPPTYLRGSFEQRLDLLQGLMDTDGTASSAANGAVFNTSSKQLAEDVRELVMSLGGTASINLRRAPQKAGFLLAYNVNMRLPPGVVPFHLQRKARQYNSVRHQKPLRAIKSIESVGFKEAQCITLDSDDGLYITDDYIVTHNSTIYTLRLDILTGVPKLRNAPQDLRDWTASLANTGGLHVTDNVHMPNSALRQELSDELCRIVTSSSPSIERRKLYSDNSIAETPVKAVFAFTAIKQPFVNADVLQRSIITELDKGDQAVEYEAGWEKRQLARFGGREGWVAHQIVFLQRLLSLIRKKWDPKYKAKFRLINVEQLLLLAAEVYGWADAAEWLPDHLEAERNEHISEADWALQGLQTFAYEWWKFDLHAGSKRLFTTHTVAEWAQSSDEFSGCGVLTNPRQLGKHLQTHKNTLSQTAGIIESGAKRNNRTQYYIKEIPIFREALKEGRNIN